MGEVFKLKAEALQFIFIGFGRLFSIGQYGLQHFSVFEQGIINISYKAAMAALRFLLVIIVVAAVIIAKFFIYTAFYGFPAGKAVFCFRCSHSNGFRL